MDQAERLRELAGKKEEKKEEAERDEKLVRAIYAVADSGKEIARALRDVADAIRRANH